MSKDITEDILLKAGFNDVTEYSNHVRYVRDNITMIHYIHAKPHVRNWECRLVANNGFASADILTQLYAIYGIGTVIDYAKESKEVQKLPDNAVKALNMWLENVNKEKKNH